MNKETLCPFRMLNKEFVDESLCLREKCELWSSGFKRCSLRLLTLLPYLQETLEEKRELKEQAGSSKSN